METVCGVSLMLHIVHAAWSSVYKWRVQCPRERPNTKEFSLVKAGIAQLVEQLICNQQVVGSNPTAGSLVKRGSASKRQSPLLGHFLDTFSVSVATKVNPPGRIRPGPGSGSDVKSGALSMLRLCRSVSTEGRSASPSLSVSACNCISGSSQIFSQFQFHLNRCFKRHRVQMFVKLGFLSCRHRRKASGDHVWDSTVK